MLTFTLIRNVKIKFASLCIEMGNFLKSWILDTEAKVIILTWYVKPNETVAINKFQRSRLTFDLSAKVTHIGVPSTF